MKLTEMRCVPCHGGVPSLTADEIAALKPQVPDWEVIDVQGIPQLRRMFKFKGYLLGVKFAQKVAEMADQEDHHPVLLIEWGRVTVTWWTHAIKGLHQNDFISAAKTDAIFQAFAGTSDTSA